MSAGQQDKGTLFRELHEGPHAFVMANVWDAGSARIVAGLGLRALATSSGAMAGVLGRRDHQVTRDEALAHARAIVAATELPVSADLKKGFGAAPSAVADTIRSAADVGLAGASIEDSTGDAQSPIYDLGLATERIAAAAAAARALPFTFTLTARAGVKRISLATSLYRAAMTGLVRAAREVANDGTFGYLDAVVATSELNDLMGS